MSLTLEFTNMEILAFIFCAVPILFVLLFATAVHYFMETLKKHDNEKSI
jgi:hypothetical protein